MALPAANPQTHAIMASWDTGTPVAALMGEFSSGKSTLLNFLLGEEVATTKVTATPLPPIWFTYSETPFVTALCENGREVDVELGDPDINYREKYLVIRVGFASDALKSCDIIDAPGLSDPDLTKDALRFLYRYFSFVIWCTAAAQAWRQTEKAAYEKLAAKTKENSILVITRADKLRYEKDEKKVFKRVSNDTKGMFGEIVVLKTPKAAAIALANRTDDHDGDWVGTGGHAFSNALETAIAATVSTPKKNVGLQGGAKSDGKEAPNKLQRAAEKKAAKKAKSAVPVDPPKQDASAQKGTHRTLKTSIDALKATNTAVEDMPVEPVQATKDLTNTQNANPTSAAKSHSAAKENFMSSTDISNLSHISGFIGACLVDVETGLMMASEGGENIDLETAGAANAEVVKAKMAAMDLLDLDENIDDILITLGSQFHLIRPLADTPSVFLFTALDKKAANLGMARVQVKKVEGSLEL